jgi:hypothetical protein
MTHLLILLSMAAPMMQDGARERVKGAVQTYVSPRTRPDERVRMVERFGAMGPAAVGFIQEAAEAAGPGLHFLPMRFLAGEVKIDLLRRQGDEAAAQAIQKLRAPTVTIDASDQSLESILDVFRRHGFPQALVNPAEQEELAKLKFSIRGSSEPMDHLLDRLLQKHKLDYYARGGVVIIATRAWLWGVPRPGAADASAQAKITEALGHLESETIDRRVAAERKIIDAGLVSMPILEKEHPRASAARKGRIEALEDRILARHIPDRLHPPDAEPALVPEDVTDFLNGSKERLLSISFFRPTPLSEIIARIAEFSETPIAFDPAVAAGIPGRKLTLAVDRASVYELVEALAVPLGAAVRPEAGRLLIIARR